MQMKTTQQLNACSFSGVALPITGQISLSSSLQTQDGLYMKKITVATTQRPVWKPRQWLLRPNQYFTVVVNLVLEDILIYEITSWLTLTDKWK